MGIPEGAKAIVVFAHGGGSNRNSPRNLHLSKILNESGFATMLVDLAALITASVRPAVAAIVSRGGRQDLAGNALKQVSAPTLFIVGGNDTHVIGLNQKALRRMTHPVRRMIVVPGANHTFDEPEASKHAATWFENYL